jgi:hypothetical protein
VFERAQKQALEDTTGNPPLVMVVESDRQHLL